MSLWEFVLSLLFKKGKIYVFNCWFVLHRLCQAVMQQEWWWKLAMAFPVQQWGRDLSHIGRTRQWGTLAQYTVVEEYLVASTNLSFEEAASLLLSVLTSVKAFDIAKFEKGKRVFIVGGSGEVGSLAIHLAKHVQEARLRHRLYQGLNIMVVWLLPVVK